MITFNNIDYRSLEEQVQKNKEDIAAHYNIDRVLADFGIRIIGQVSTPEELPDPETFVGDYGDAYAVGAQEPYVFYVWTRADVNAGQPNDYWFNIGQLAIVGPQGPMGPQGSTGPAGESSKWLYSATSNGVVGTSTGDMLLTQNGNVYRWTGSVWNLTTNIKGPQGTQGIQGIQGPKGDQGEPGPQGPQGDVGGSINIQSIVSTVDQLPTPESLQNLTVAYLVGSASPYDLYIQVGTSSATALWTNVGGFNAATLVTVDGVGQNVWDADTKVTKQQNRSQGQAGQTFLYGFGRDSAGYPTDNTYIASTARTSGHIVRYAEGGRLNTNAATTNLQAVNLQQLNETLAPTSTAAEMFLSASAPLVTTSSGVKRAVVQNYGNGITPFGLVQSDAMGKITAADPVEDQDVVTLKYFNQHNTGGGSTSGGKRGYTLSATSGSEIFFYYKADGTNGTMATVFDPVDDVTLISIPAASTLTISSPGPYYIEGQGLKLGVQTTLTNTTTPTLVIPLCDGMSVYRIS